jgi:hypothetical protein
MRDAPGPSVRCSFCGKDRSLVDFVVAGPAKGAQICNECLRLRADTFEVQTKRPESDR